ncbi:MAG: hypothetical protein H0Z33_11170 [Bacillaceae bacterium]|nr:hypothetical protein [Bacillaceae bacterium]
MYDQDQTVYFPEDIREDVLLFDLFELKAFFQAIIIFVVALILFVFIPIPIGFRLLFILLPAFILILAVAFDLPVYLKKRRRYKREPAIRTAEGGKNTTSVYFPITGIDGPFVEFQSGDWAVFIRCAPPPWDYLPSMERFSQAWGFQKLLRSLHSEGAELLITSEEELDLQIDEWQHQESTYASFSPGLKELGLSRVQLQRDMAEQGMIKKTYYLLRITISPSQLQLGKNVTENVQLIKEKLQRLSGIAVQTLSEMNIQTAVIAGSALEEVVLRQFDPLLWRKKRIGDKNQGKSQIWDQILQQPSQTQFEETRQANVNRKGHTGNKGGSWWKELMQPFQERVSLQKFARSIKHRKEEKQRMHEEYQREVLSRLNRHQFNRQVLNEGNQPVFLLVNNRGETTIDDHRIQVITPGMIEAGMYELETGILIWDDEVSIDHIPSFQSHFPNCKMYVLYEDEMQAVKVREYGVAGVIPKPLTAEKIERLTGGDLVTENRLDFMEEPNEEPPSPFRFDMKIPSKHTLVFISPKGGVGQSLLAVSTAEEIKRMSGGRVCVVDMDEPFGNIGSFFYGSEYRPSIKDWVRAGEMMSEREALSLLHEHPEGFYILPVSRGERLITRDLLQKVMHHIYQFFDWVIIDAGTDWNGNTIQILQWASSIFLVTEEDVIAIRDTQDALGFIRKAGISTDKVKVVVGKSRGEMDPETIREFLHLPVLPPVPELKEVREAIGEGYIPSEVVPKYQMAIENILSAVMPVPYADGHGSIIQSIKKRMTR